MPQFGKVSFAEGGVLDLFINTIYLDTIRYGLSLLTTTHLRWVFRSLGCLSTRTNYLFQCFPSAIVEDLRSLKSDRLPK